MLANPVLHALRYRFPYARIDMVVDDVFEELLFENPNVNNVILHTRNPEGMKWIADISMLLKLRKNRYDLVVDLQGGPRGAWTAFFTGAGIRVGHHLKARNRMLYNLRPEIASPIDHTWKVQFMIAQPLAISLPKKPQFHLSIPEETQLSMVEKMDKAGLRFDRPLVLLHPGARIQVKRWPAARMGALARWLVDEKQVAVALAGSKNDFEEIKLIRKASRYALPYFADLSLGELAALIKISDMVVCNDSGPMHMAGVLGTPTVSLFGPSDPIIWGPVGNRNISISANPPMECMPCKQKGCPHKGHHCMTRIAVEDAIQAVSRLNAI